MTLDLIQRASSWADPALFGTDRPVVWEVGFAPGWALIARAKAQPELNFLGIELPGAYTEDQEEPTLSDFPPNVRLIYTDVRAVVEALPPGLRSVQKLIIDFPNPAASVRFGTHIFQPPDALGEILRLLEPGGELELRTESHRVVRRVRQVVQTAGDARNLSVSRGKVQASYPSTPAARRFERRSIPAYVIRYRNGAPTAPVTEATAKRVQAAKRRVEVAVKLLAADRTLKWQVIGPSVAGRFSALGFLSPVLPGVVVDPGGKDTSDVVALLAPDGKAKAEATYYGTDIEFQGFKVEADLRGIWPGEKPIQPGSEGFAVFFQRLLENLTALSAEMMEAWAQEKGVDLRQLVADLELLEKA